MWEKIKAVAVKLSPDVLKIVKEAGPKLAESLKKLGAIVIKAGKKIVIELKGEIIRIIDAEEIAESSDEFAMEKRGIKDSKRSFQSSKFFFCIIYLLFIVDSIKFLKIPNALIN